MPGIGIITNPHSRRNRRNPEQMRRMGYILGQNDTYELTNRVEDVSRVAEQFRDNDIDILALNGGDGTNHVTLTQFIQVYGEHPLPRIALLRGGTMNTTAEGMGIHGTPSRLLANLVEKYYTGQPFETTERDTLRVTDENAARYGFIFGNGIVSNFLEIYYDTGTPSPATAAALLARAVVSVTHGGELAQRITRPFRASVDLDDGREHWPVRDYRAIVAATVDQIGLGFRPFVRSEERPGAFHILGIHGSTMAIARDLPRMRLGLPVSPEIALSSVASRAVFRCEEPIVYTIDGEMHVSQQGQVELGCGPRLEIILK